MEHRVLAFLLVIPFIACSSVDREFDAGARQAESDLREGVPIVVDYYGAPGIVRVDNSLGLLVPGCTAPRGRLLEALDTGARSGTEIYKAVVAQWPELAGLLENRAERVTVWPEGSSPAIVECSAEDPDVAPQTCAWLLLSRDAPKASKPWVLGYNRRVLERINEGTPCENVLWDNARAYAEEP